MKRLFFASMMAILLMAFNSCREQWPYYHEYKSIDNNAWFTNDKAELHVPALPSDTTLNMAVCLRNTQDYPYQHLYVNLNVKDDTTQQNIKVLNLKLPVFDDKGLPLGKGFPFMETEYDIEGQPVHLKKGHTYTICIWHDMHSPTIPGIADVGIKLY
ncbi:MAG: gliding motility lipoprotein GldH [Bacteroidaceae bacterium]|nr:gliding motility lipoprotein GldH [Bacteroidaceae bacterium]